MTKTVFPMDNTDYYAKDMRAWHIGRTAGIINYTGNDLAVSSAGGMNLSIKPGAAYLFTGSDDPGGIIYLNNESETFIGQTASSTDRYDYICIEYNESENTASAKYVKGTGSQPTPLRNATTYQIIVAVIRVRANAGSITNADIIDTRLNETYCGLAVDSLARIPTDQYYAQFKAFMESIEGALGNDIAGNLLLMIQSNTNRISTNENNIEKLTQSTDNISSRLNSEITRATAKDSELSSRIDQLVAPSESEITLDAEVIDIRVGFDGTKYNNAGEAVRKQVGSVADDLTKTVNYSIENIGGKVTSYIYDKYNVGDVFPPIARSGYYYGFYTADENSIINDISFVACANNPAEYMIPSNYSLNVFANDGTNYTLKETIPSTGVYVEKTTSSYSFYKILFPVVQLKKGELLTVNGTDPDETDTNNIAYEVVTDTNIISFKNDIGNTIPVSSVSKPKVELNCKFTVYKQKLKQYVVVDINGNGNYTSVVEAVENEPENTVIFIKPGVYEGTIQAFEKRIILIGADRNSCILKSIDGRYAYPCVNGSCGYLENLTLISEYVKGESQEIGNTSGAYAFHCENEYGVGKALEFHHCTLISDFSPALGVGTRKDFTCIIDDCILENRQIDGRGVYIEDGSLGALYFHDPNGEKGESKMICKNSILRSKLKNAMCPYSQKIEGNSVICTFVNNVLYSETNKYTDNIWWRNGNAFDEGYFKLDIGYGNSNSELNDF